MTRVHTRHARLTHRERLEQFNRASHSDALREMQLAPADQLPLHGATLSWRSYAAFGALCFVLVGML